MDGDDKEKSKSSKSSGGSSKSDKSVPKPPTTSSGTAPTQSSVTTATKVADSAKTTVHADLVDLSGSLFESQPGTSESGASNWLTINKPPGQQESSKEISNVEKKPDVTVLSSSNNRTTSVTAPKPATPAPTVTIIFRDSPKHGDLS